MALSEEEQAIVRQGRLFREMIESAGWKEYEKLLLSHIESRRRELDAPILVKDDRYLAVDAGTKLAISESIKGAIIALRLAIALPSATVEQARELTRTSPNDE